MRRVRAAWPPGARLGSAPRPRPELNGLGGGVVGAQLESDHAVRLFTARSRVMIGISLSVSKPPRDIEAVAIRKHQVEQHEAWLDLGSEPLQWRRPLCRAT